MYVKYGWMHGFAMAVLSDRRRAGKCTRRSASRIGNMHSAYVCIYMQYVCVCACIITAVLSARKRAGICIRLSAMWIENSDLCVYV
jgi:hypothetical protein